ncbi:MAG TPA: 6,7-dimethyl-8-ribityllumazine synthase [Acidimicrobiales bacterium]|jgi:6,7-dimethyl-8-ribityllumazine synthase
MSSENRAGLSTGAAPLLDGSGLRVALACGRFNDRITNGLLAGCRARLTELQVDDGDITEHWAPGAFELPLVARHLAETGRVDAVVTLGAVIRGDTPHFEFVAGECAAGVARVALDTGVPIVFGVLTTDTVGQAFVRSVDGPGNKGRESADTAVEMACLIRGIRGAAGGGGRVGFRGGDGTAQR